MGWGRGFSMKYYYVLQCTGFDMRTLSKIDDPSKIDRFAYN